MKRSRWVTLALAVLILALTCGAAPAATKGGPLNDEGSVRYEDDYSGTVRIGGTDAAKDYGSGNDMHPAAAEVGVANIGSCVFCENDRSSQFPSRPAL